MSLIPTYKLMPGDFTYTAKYNRDLETLFLTVEGYCPCVAFAYEFKQLSFYGGLKFEFDGMVGPVLGPPGLLVQFKQNFQIKNSGLIPQRIFIVDAKHPAGLPVDIEFLLSSLPQLPSVISPEQLATTDLSKLILRPPIKLVVFLGESVPVKVSVNPEGVKFKYNEEKLDLVNAEINGQNEIVWTLKTIATGTSLVSATSGFGFGNETIWEIICIGINDNPSDIAADRHEPFLDGLKKAVETVRETWKDAELYYVSIDRRPFNLDAIWSPYQFRWLNATFHVDDNKNTVEIRTVGNWNVWAPPTFYPGIRIGTAQMKWPLEGDLDFPEAFALVVAADPKKQGVKSASLFQLIYPHLPPEIQNQPYYQFDMAEGDLWAVGSVTKKAVKLGNLNPDGKADAPAADATASTAPPVAVAA